MKYLLWLLKAAIFFTLFAFALNNQQIVSVNFFFGTLWQAPLVIVVLATFAAGVALGILLMMPRWWKKRRALKHTEPSVNPGSRDNLSTDPQTYSTTNAEANSSNVKPPHYGL
jgi:uncharacterized integral membrane protein